MLSDPELLDFLANVCRARRITAVSSSVLDAWHAVLKLDRTGEVGASQAPKRAALLLAAVIDPDLEQTRERLGPEVADLVEQLAPSGGRLGLDERTALWCRKARDGGAAGEAALQLLAAEVATSRPGQESDSLRSYVEILALDQQASPETRRTAQSWLDELSSKTGTTPQLEAEHQPLLVSLSIDMAGSTEAKTRMLALAADDERCHELYRQLYREFLRHEDRFYAALFSTSAGFHGPALDWRRLFVVKGIGDEIWILYELDRGSKDDRRSAPVRLLSAALSLVAEVIAWGGTERSSDPTTTPDEEMQQRFDRMDLAYKVHMDLIVDALEISGVRAEYVGGNVGRYLGRENARFDGDAADLAGRLNAGQFDILGRRLRQVFRTDYIGHEVDRFFRTTKAALPGIVTVGQALFDHLRPDVKLVAYPGLFRAHLEYELDPTQPGSRRGWNDLLFSTREMPASELKGVGYPYRVHCFATRPQLNMLWRRALDEPLVAPILDVFPAELRDRLKTSAEIEAAERFEGVASTGHGGQ